MGRGVMLAVDIGYGHWSKPAIYKLKCHFNGYFRSLAMHSIFCVVLVLYFIYIYFNFHSVHFRPTLLGFSVDSVRGEKGFFTI